MVRNRKKKSKKVVLACDHAGFKLKEEIMNIYDKIRNFCKVFRIILGVVALVAGFYFVGEDQTYNMWFLLGIAPLVAGITNFCPICLITKKCSIK